MAREAGGDAQPSMNAVVALVYSSAIALSQTCLDAASRLSMCDLRAVYMALMAAALQLAVLVLLTAGPQQAPASQPRPSLLLM